MPIEYVQVNGGGLDHEHRVNPNGPRVNFDRYPCLAQNCWAEFEMVETAAPGAHRRARNLEVARRIEAERAAAAAEHQRRQRRRRRRGWLFDLAAVAVAIVVLYAYARHGG